LETVFVSPTMSVCYTKSCVDHPPLFIEIHCVSFLSGCGTYIW